MYAGICMHRAQALILALWLALPAFSASFDGERALEATRKVVSFGNRTPGSPGSKQMQAWIVSQLKLHGWEVIEDPFTARTPKGPIAMKNIIGRRMGLSGQAVAVSGHMDTKFFPFRFEGANDAGSSTGLLIELVCVLKDVRLKNDVYLIFHDGEEAIVDWTPEDSLYGSRHLAERWHREGVLRRIKALINVDMVGDKDLEIVKEYYSVESLRRLVWQVAADLGYGRYFGNKQLPIEDDHVPYLRKGVPAVNLIDFEYGPNHSWWHTPEDTMDKVSARSLEVVGRVVVETLRRLEPR